MIGKGPRLERETVIVYNEAEPTASIWTASEVVYRRLKKLGYMPSEDEERHAVFTVPKAVVRILGPRAKRTLSPEHREALQKGRLRSRGLSTEEGNGHRGADSAMVKG